MPLDQPTDRDAQARAILRANDRGGYTVPSARLYPFQWNWDSPLTAIGWATFDLERALKEFDTLLTGQWADGMIPSIVFHAESDGYYPGPGAWGTTHAPMTTGITQPPVAASCLRRIVDGAPDRAATLKRVETLICGLFRWHRWWHETRDPDATGLVSCLHPWETGRDNSCEWDLPLAAVTPTVDVAHLRKDILHADPSERPTHDYYNRVMTLVEEGKSVDWDGRACLRRSSFRVCDLGIQSLLLRGDEDLAVLARAAGMTRAAEQLEAWRARSIAAMAQLWNPIAGAFQSRDLRTDRLLDALSVGAFLPLYAGAADRTQAASLAKLMRGALETCRFGAPSTLPQNPGFDPRRYWRGPVWPFMNRLVAEGFARYGQDGIAARIRHDTRRLIESGGFREYFHPQTGEGLGGADFSWSAAAWLVWAGRE
jgi:hypothetical protein